VVENHSSFYPEDPWIVLGIDSTADEQQIRAAYLRNVKTFPPDRAPQEFERVRDAYQQLRDPRRRSHHMILAADPQADMVALLGEHQQEKRFVGPELWWAALGKKP